MAILEKKTKIRQKVPLFFPSLFLEQNWQNGRMTPFPDTFSPFSLVLEREFAVQCVPLIVPIV
ncbi:MAG: hypothetical protein D6679_04635 [Candidatus Hydrogenedentota bacterium]|nr:MAG: hypothetical protein D6679_04635 [Candidatus Hydrogenedentota bacterium]